MLRFGSVPSLVPTFLVAGALVFYSGTAAERIILLASFSQPDTTPSLTVPNTTPSLTMPVA